jgi:glycosyltransferase involved in cell wall biosynthesis
MEYHIDVLSEGLGKRGHSVTIVTTSHPQGRESETKGNLEIQYIPDTKPGAYSNEWWDSSKKRIGEITSQSDVDIFHSQSIACHGALNVIQDSDVELITTSHGTPITDALSYSRTAGFKSSPIVMGKTLYYFKHHRKVYRSSNNVIAVSAQLGDHIIKWRLAKEDQVTTIPNGIDLQKFKPGLDANPIRESLGLKEEKVLLFLGRVRQEKGVDLAIKSLPYLSKKVGSTALVIVGDGDFSDEVIPLAKSLGMENQVHYVGKIEEEQVPIFHNLADVFLMPSTRWEALPLSLLEAIASGSVVVASNVGGIPSVIGDGYNGILIQKGSLESLVDGCLRAFSSIASDLSINAREFAQEHHDAEKMVDSVISLYEKASS